MKYAKQRDIRAVRFHRRLMATWAHLKPIRPILREVRPILSGLSDTLRELGRRSGGAA